jgi:type 1 glutamine amidotransferase
MLTFRTSLALGILCAVAASANAEPTLKALIVDGQNNHNWKATTPVLKRILEDSGLFKVDVATAPAKGGDMATFKPTFADYQVVVSNYNGEEWSQETKDALISYVRGGGGFVVVHAANNSFPAWKEYNEMIGLGGWGGRNETSGPYVRFRDNKFVFDTQPGPGGHHGKQHPFQVVIRKLEHPITAGLPIAWMHAQDELYDKMRGPAQNMNVLATAYADPATGGSGEHEPMLFTISYGDGRVFHTTLGHSAEAMQCVGFIVTLARGAEWAATGSVTQQSIPSDFPAADKVSTRNLIEPAAK